MNTPPPEITDPLLKSLVEEAADLPRMAALEARKARGRKRTPRAAAFRSFRPLPGIVWLLQFRATQAALALLLLAAMIEGGSLLSGERAPFARTKGVDLLSAATVTTKSGDRAAGKSPSWVNAVSGGVDGETDNEDGKAVATNVFWTGAQAANGTSDPDGDGFVNNEAYREKWQPSQYLRNSELHFDYSLGTGNIGKIQYSGGNTVSPTTGFTGSGTLINGIAGATSVLDNGVYSVKMGVTNGSSTFAGTITNGIGRVNINKVGSGTEVLTGTNAYTGMTNAGSGYITGLSGTVTNSGIANTTSGTLNWNGNNVTADALTGSGTVNRFTWNNQTSQGQSAPWQTELHRPAPKLAARNEPNAGASSGGDPAQPVATPPLVDARKLIRNAALDFEVASFESALDTVGKVAGEEQGYILTQNSEKGANGKLQGTIIVKVLPGNLDRFLLKLRALGDMKNQTVGGNDVTKDYYDTEAHIRNSQVTEARLVEMMKTRTGKVSDLLEVENEIAKVRGEIEQMQGQLKYYDGLVQYATVTITLREKDINQAAAYLLQEHAQLSLFAKDVETAFAEAKTDATNAKAQTLDSRIERNESGQEVATLHLLLPPENSDEAVMKLKAIGRIQNFNSQTQRVSRDGSAPSDTAKIDRDKVEISILIQRDAENPVQGTNIGVQTDQVEEKTAQIKQAAAAAGVEVKGAEFNRAQNGVEVSAMLLRMPVKKYAAFLEQIKSLGKVKNFTVSRREDATATEDAPAEIALQIFSQGSIVAPETGLWVTIRHTLGEGMGALMWSVRMIGVSLAWIAPWAVIAGMGWWMVARRRRRAAKKQG